MLLFRVLKKLKLTLSPADNKERAAQILTKMASTESELRLTANQMGGETLQAARQKAHGVPKAPGAMTLAAIVL